MKIQITEALRLKNEISNNVRDLEFNAKNNIIVGNIYEDGVLSTDGEGLAYKDTIEKLELALKFSEEINGKLADFNRLNNVDDFIRQKQNLKMLKEVYENILPKTKPTTSNSWVILGDTRKQVLTEYRPLLQSKEVKEKIRIYKNSIREIQTKVEKLNQKTIELSFEYQDVDNLGLG